MKQIVLVFLAAMFVGGVLGDDYKFGNMTMYLVRAGRFKWAMKSEQMLRNNSRITICPDDFRRGFTIRCMPSLPFRIKYHKVSFYVNNKFHKLQVVVPYYLNGNNFRRVKAYYFGARSYLKVMCKANGVRPATVIIRKVCPELDESPVPSDEFMSPSPSLEDWESPAPSDGEFL